jgi:O-antigen/teichoic acid export membrane protein
VVLSVRNAAKLGASLLATWTVALGVRILLPRYLGPAAFGMFQFADAFTMTAFVLTGLGVETYVRKEVATRSMHASEFFGGTLLIQLAVSAIVMIGAVWGLGQAGKPAEVIELVVIVGVFQALVNVNATAAAILQATGRVDGLSILNVVSKALWGAGILVAMMFHGGLRSVAIAMVVAETVRTLGLAVLTRAHAGLRLTVNLATTSVVLAASFPYYLSTLAQTVYSRLDVSVLSFLATDTEVGWYGVASNLAGMALLLAPLIGWVLLPLTSRAAARSEAELNAVSRRAMELILSAALPVSLFLYLAADVLVLTLFGPAFAPAITSLRVLAPLFVLTYVAMVSASLLIRLERGWAVTWISLAGMVASPLLNIWCIPRGAALLGRGGSGVGAAVALILTEVLTTVSMTWLLGGRAFDRRSRIALAKTCVVCAIVAMADILLAPIGAWRLVVDATLYLVLVIAWGALDIRRIVTVARAAIARRPPDDALIAGA